MKILKFMLCIAFVPLLWSSTLTFADTVVVIHPSNSAALDEATVKKIFLGKIKSFPGGGPAVPISRNEGSASRAEFDKNVLGKSSSQIKAYWSKLVFTGKGTPPKEVDNDEEVKTLVSSNPNIIGYLDSAQVDDSVKVIFSF